MEKTKLSPMEELEARRMALWALLESYSSEAHNVFLVKPHEVEEAIKALDDDAIVSEFMKNIAISEGCDGICYEWYYGGDPNCDVAYGYGYESCDVGDFSKTDLVKIPSGPHLERNEPGELIPEGDENEVYAGYIDVKQVMHPWYAALSPRYNKADYTGIINTPLHVPFNDSQNIYNELFRIKLYMLVNRALTEMKAEPYVFMSLHERWPILVYAPE